LKSVKSQERWRDLSSVLSRRVFRETNRGLYLGFEAAFLSKLQQSFEATEINLDADEVPLDSHAACYSRFRDRSAAHDAGAAIDVKHFWP